jgi:hypothetical protein
MLLNIQIPNLSVRRSFQHDGKEKAPPTWRVIICCGGAKQFKWSNFK